MKLFRVYITILFLLNSLFGHGQGTILCPKFNVSIKSYYDSIKIAKINNFLNDSLAKIELVRIKPHQKIVYVLDVYNSSPITIKKHLDLYETIVQDDSIESNMISDSKNLSDSDYVKIIQFMFTQSNRIGLGGRCGYEPRNGILFYGADNKFLGFIEICFKCDGHRYTDNFDSFVQINSLDFTELKILFEGYQISVH